MALRCVTLQGVPGEAQLTDDVSGDVGLDALTLLGMALCCFQQMVKLLGIKLLQGREEGERRDGVKGEKQVMRRTQGEKKGNNLSLEKGRHKH